MKDKQLALIISDALNEAGRKFGIKPSRIWDIRHEHRCDREARKARACVMRRLKEQGMPAYVIARAFGLDPSTVGQLLQGR